jgi:hypothetical protein
MEAYKDEELYVKFGIFGKPIYLVFKFLPNEIQDELVEYIKDTFIERENLKNDIVFMTKNGHTSEIRGKQFEIPKDFPLVFRDDVTWHDNNNSNQMISAISAILKLRKNIDTHVATPFRSKTHNKDCRRQIYYQPDNWTDDRKSRSGDWMTDCEFVNLPLGEGEDEVSRTSSLLKKLLN